MNAKKKRKSVESGESAASKNHEYDCLNSIDKNGGINVSVDSIERGTEFSSHGIRVILKRAQSRGFVSITKKGIPGVRGRPMPTYTLTEEGKREVYFRNSEIEFPKATMEEISRRWEEDRKNRRKLEGDKLMTDREEPRKVEEQSKDNNETLDIEPEPRKVSQPRITKEIEV